MAHFAKIVNGIVEDVIVIEPEDLNDYLDNNLLHQIDPGQWIETSYNTRGGVHYDPSTGEPSADQSLALRGNFAGKGFHYDEDLDAFYCSKNHPSWTLNTTTFTWEPPIAKPDGNYQWDEDAYQADNTTGWVAGPDLT